MTRWQITRSPDWLWWPGLGELYSLSVNESIEVVRRTVRVVRGRMPVFAGVGYGYPLAVEMARGMEQAGADILLVLPPYYSNPPMEGLIRYYQEISNACGIPLGLYRDDDTGGAGGAVRRTRALAKARRRERVSAAAMAGGGARGLLLKRIAVVSEWRVIQAQLRM